MKEKSLLEFLGIFILSLLWIESYKLLHILHVIIR